MNDWQKWYEEHKNDPQPLDRRIRAMQSMYGTGPEGTTCKNCAFLVRRRFSRTYLKCLKFKDTRGPATDWKASYPACGLYKEEKDLK